MTATFYHTTSGFACRRGSFLPYKHALFVPRCACGWHYNNSTIPSPDRNPRARNQHAIGFSRFFIGSIYGIHDRSSGRPRSAPEMPDCWVAPGPTEMPDCWVAQGPTHPRAASVIPAPPFTAPGAADRAPPWEGAHHEIGTSNPVLIVRCPFWCANLVGWPNGIR